MAARTHGFDRPDASLSFEELRTVAKADGRVEALEPGEQIVAVGGIVSILKSYCDRIEVIGQGPRMGLASWNEVLLHAAVDFEASRPEPRAAAGRERRWLLDLDHPKHIHEEGRA